MYLYLIFLQGESSTAGTTSDIAGALARLHTQSTSTETAGILSSDDMVNEGFMKIPKQEVTHHKFSQVSQISSTIVYLDDKGSRRVMQIKQDFQSANSNKAIIITGTGELVEAQSSTNCWVDANGKDHECETCQLIKGTCTSCLIETRLEIVGKSIKLVKTSQLTQALRGLAEIIQNDGYDKKEAQIEELLTEIESLAEEYGILDAKTGRVVRNVKSYGELILEAVKEHLDDKDINFFWEQIQSMDTVKGSLKDANDKHDAIKNTILDIQGEASVKATKFNSKNKDTVKYLYIEEPSFNAALGTPVIGQFIGSVYGAKWAAKEAYDRCEERGVLAQAVAGTVGLVAGGVIGLGASIAMLPAAPYYWWKYVSSVSDIKKFGEISSEFGSIADKMGTVEVHLDKISEALWDIESKLDRTIETEKKTRKQLTPWLRDKFVSKMRKNADQLIESCDIYLSLSKQRNHLHQPLEVEGNDSPTE